MTQARTSQGKTPKQRNTQKKEQSATQDSQRALQEGTPDTTKEVQESLRPTYPNWPTSLPGPMVKPPPPGMQPLNGIRREQMVEVGYDQETGEPSTLDPERANPEASQKGRTSFDQLKTSDDLKK